MTEAEKELVFSKTMTNTLEGKYIRDIIQEYFKQMEKNQSLAQQMARAGMSTDPQPSKKSKTNKSSMNESGTLAADQAGTTDLTDKMSLYDQNQRKIRDDAFQKLKNAIHFKESEKVDTPSSTTTQSESSKDSFFEG